MEPVDNFDKIKEKIGDYNEKNNQISFSFPFRSSGMGILVFSIVMKYKMELPDVQELVENYEVSARL